ncbi:MAG: 8-amino-7-oxononanoate synthase [Planctomycetota bacterium]|jgi:8-amino-7-oxononanoate synthase|nr:8-amino-7-oxononanoate synthase [Planctomycetota bacterium]
MDFSEDLQRLREQNLYRTLNTVSAPAGPETVINGKKVLLFSSNSYLGIANNPLIKARVIREVEKFGTGSGGSRLTTGNFTIHRELEERLAAFKGTEDAVLFNCGYLANLGSIAALTSSGDYIFSDQLNHASIIDGCRLSRAKTLVYAHADLDDLRAKIAAVKPERGLIVTDGVFSMDGDLAPLPGLLRVAGENHLRLLVDDAHATGVVGATGRGTSEHFGLRPGEVDILVGTLSKAVAAEGGFVAGSQDLCDYLRNQARPFIFSTALAPATVAAALGGVDYLANHPEAVQRLRQNIAYFVSGLQKLGYPVAGESAIIPLLIGDEGKAKAVSDAMFDRGVYVPCIRYPTVERGAARLRFTLMASHETKAIDYALKSLAAVLESFA